MQRGSSEKLSEKGEEAGKIMPGKVDVESEDESEEDKNLKNEAREAFHKVD